MSVPKKYYIIAGEASGDLHGGNLIIAMKKLDPTVNVRCWGGDKMKEAGGVLVKHYRETAVMGMIEVLRKLRFLRKLVSQCKQDIINFQPDAVILIDYAGFNLRIAKFSKQHNLKVYYYIPPKVWAWRESRVKQLRKYVDKLFVIFPFEVPYFKKHGIDVFYAGNPLVENLANYSFDTSRLESEIDIDNDTRPIIAILPGSRKQEIQHILPRILPVIPHYPNYQFVIATLSGISEDIYTPIIQGYDVKVVKDLTLEVLSYSKAAIVASGTATLETALLKIPQVVCYCGNPITIFFAKLLLKLHCFSLVNIILNENVVKELLQSELTTASLSEELSQLLYNVKKIDFIQEKYVTLSDRLAGHDISEQIAREMFARPIKV